MLLKEPGMRIISHVMAIHPTEMEKYRRLPWSLAHLAFNNFFYTWTFGSSIFLLFLDELGLPKDQIGLLLAFFPFCGLLALFTGSIIARWGRKRIFLLGYGIRKPVMASLLLLPWVIVALGNQSALVFLSGVILTVAVLRALAETAFLPWYQEYVPNAVRGKYTSVSNIVLTISSVIALWSAGWLIAQSEGIRAYMILIGTGALLGLVGVFLMLPVPGGNPIPGEGSSRLHWANLRRTLQDPVFRYYLGGMACFIFGSVMLVSFLPLFMKDNLGIPAETVVKLEIASMAGGALASVISGILADRIGSRKIMLPGLALTILIPPGWFAISAAAPVNGSATTILLIVASAVMFFLLGAFSSTASLGAGRMLYNEVIPVEKSTAYTSIYYAWAGLMGGVSPILAGKLLTSASQLPFGVFSSPSGGYHLLFGLSLVGFTAAFFFYRQAKPGELSSQAEESNHV